MASDRSGWVADRKERGSGGQHRVTPSSVQPIQEQEYWETVNGCPQSRTHETQRHTRKSPILLLIPKRPVLVHGFASLFVFVCVCLFV